MIEKKMNERERMRDKKTRRNHKRNQFDDVFIFPVRSEKERNTERKRKS